mgnify:CR=1 FL=1
MRVGGGSGGGRAGSGAGWEPSPRAALVFVGILTLLAALLRLARLGLSPPGLCQDEAISAWNAYCLLRTGRDMAGVSWPIFYAHGFGGSPTVLLPYLIIPFQALGGLSVLTTRLVPAVCGILCVPLLLKGATIGVIYVDNRLQVGIFSSGRHAHSVTFAVSTQSPSTNRR